MLAVIYFEKNPQKCYILKKIKMFKELTFPLYILKKELKNFIFEKN